VEISFRQLRNGLTFAASRMTGQPPEQITQKDLEKYFGPTWSDPRAWYLIDVNVAHEVHNEEPTKRAFIGGGVTELLLRAFP
jgi:hypothetical protein